MLRLDLSGSEDLFVYSYIIDHPSHSSHLRSPTFFLAIVHSTQRQRQTRFTYSMSAVNRSAGRDVHIYDANDPATVLGGLILTKGVTNANFYSMLEIFILLSCEYFLRHGDERDTRVPRDGQLLAPGNYYIVTNGTFLRLEHDQAAADYGT